MGPIWTNNIHGSLQEINEMHTSLQAEAHSLRTIAHDLPPETNENAFDVYNNYPFLTSQSGKLYVGPFRGYHSDIFMKYPELYNDYPKIKGRYQPYSNEYYLYPDSVEHNSPQLQQQLHHEFNRADTPHTHHLTYEDPYEYEDEDEAYLNHLFGGD